MPNTIPNTVFDDSALFISARSPFARRVRVAFREHGISCEEKAFNVFQENPELFALNPLHRVPVLRLRSGEVIADSGSILQVFYREVKSPFEPYTNSDQILAAHWSGLGVGLCEKTVEYYLETLRPQASQDEEVLRDFEVRIRALLRRLEEHLAGREGVLGSQLCQADFDLGCGLGYLALRASALWASEQQKNPGVSRYLDALQARPSFQATVPPPA